MMENSPDFLMAEGAMAKLGTIGALINTNLRGAALAHVLRASTAASLLADAACWPALRELGAARRRVAVFADAPPDALRGTPLPLAARGARRGGTGGAGHSRRQGRPT